MIGVIDYQAGNLRSVETALAHLGLDYIVLDKPDGVQAVDRLIFPGVGHAGHAMKVLSASGLDQAIAAFFKSGKPLLGICVGSQVVLDSSDEGDTVCMGLVRGKVHHFKTLLEPIAGKTSQPKTGSLIQGAVGATSRGHGVSAGVALAEPEMAHDLGGYVVNGERLKVPHMGWNTVHYDESATLAQDLFSGIPQGSSFYFVHSYYTAPEGSTLSLCSTEYGTEFCSGLGRDNLAAFQFHPEKSGRWGLKLLENFAKAG